MKGLYSQDISTENGNRKHKLKFTKSSIYILVAKFFRAVDFLIFNFR